MPQDKLRRKTRDARKSQGVIPASLKGITNGHGNGTTERRIIINKLQELDTTVKQYRPANIQNPLGQNRVGVYRPIQKRKCITADMEIIEYFYKELGCPCPSFLEAGPRENLYFDPQN